MPYITDNLADYSRISSVSFMPTVPSGLTTFALFGRTLNSSLINLANSAAPLSVTLNLGINATSGVTVTNFNQLVTPDVANTGSETIYLVMSVNPTNWASFLCSPFGSNPVNSNTATEINCQNGVAGLQANVGFNISGTPGSRVCSVTAGGLGIISGDTATQAVIVNPQLYMFKIDMANLLVTLQNMSQTAASWTSHIVITSGWTREAITAPYAMGANTAADGAFTNATNMYHAYAHYNRATTSAEDTLISAQLRKIMATRGVSV